MAEEEEKKLAQEEKYSSLVEEAESKTRKVPVCRSNPRCPPAAAFATDATASIRTGQLKQLWAKFRAAQAEIDDLQMEQQQEKQDLVSSFGG